MPVYLQKEPFNPYDGKAIAVYLADAPRVKLGYVPRDSGVADALEYAYVKPGIDLTTFTSYVHFTHTMHYRLPLHLAFASTNLVLFPEFITTLTGQTSLLATPPPAIPPPITLPPPIATQLDRWLQARLRWEPGAVVQETTKAALAAAANATSTECVANLLRQQAKRMEVLEVFHINANAWLQLCTESLCRRGELHGGVLEEVQQIEALCQDTVSQTVLDLILGVQTEVQAMKLIRKLQECYGYWSGRTPPSAWCGALYTHLQVWRNSAEYQRRMSTPSTVARTPNPHA